MPPTITKLPHAKILAYNRAHWEVIMKHISPLSTSFSVPCIYARFGTRREL